MNPPLDVRITEAKAEYDRLGVAFLRQQKTTGELKRDIERMTREQGTNQPELIAKTGLPDSFGYTGKGSENHEFYSCFNFPFKSYFVVLLTFCFIMVF